MTDCTLWPDRLGSIDWSACCRAHDAAYDLGLDKTRADRALFTCVEGVGGWLFFRHRNTDRSGPHG